MLNVGIQQFIDYGYILKEYYHLIDEKNKILHRFNSLQSIDFSKEKISNPIKRNTSEEERYAIRMEKINNKIKEYECWLKPEKERLLMQLSRVKKYEHRLILTKRYIEQQKFKDIIADIFGLEDDFEDQKYGKYHDKVFYWHKQAVKEIEMLKTIPFIPTEQLRLKIHEILSASEPSAGADTSPQPSPQGEGNTKMFIANE